MREITTKTGLIMSLRKYYRRTSESFEAGY